MKFTTLIAASALAVASTAATAQNVTTPTGDVVMIEKNQGSLALLGLSSTATAAAVLVIVATIAAAADASGGT